MDYCSIGRRILRPLTSAASIRSFRVETRLSIMICGVCLGPSSVTGNPKILADAVAACGLFTGFGDIVGGGKK